MTSKTNINQYKPTPVLIFPILYFIIALLITLCIDFLLLGIVSDFLHICIIVLGPVCLEIIIQDYSDSTTKLEYSDFDYVGSNAGLTRRRHWINFIHQRRRRGFNRVTLMPLVDTVLDELPGNAAWSVLPVGKDNLPLWISLALLISDIICTYETLSNEMTRLSAECTGQRIHQSHRLSVGAGAGMRCCRLLGREHFEESLCHLFE
jgi:hypothetical protein